MPRQQINYPDLTQKDVQRELRTHQGYDLAESDFGPWNESAVHIGWHDGWMQIGLEVDLEYAKMASSVPNGATSDRTIMYSPTLTKTEIDDLIATLKRAKRRAFKRPLI